MCIYYVKKVYLLQGLWANLTGLDGCIDGTVCHQPPPPVKKHSGAVASSTEVGLVYGTKVEYKCDVKSKLVDSSKNVLFFKCI